MSLFEQSWERGNPIQYVDVSDEHTVCATINRVYSWGVVDFSLEKDVDSSTFTPRRDGVETIPLPNGSNLEQVIAGAQFTAV